MILIENNQDIAVDVDQLERDAQKILDLLEYTDYDLGILLTTNDDIHTYNKQYRNQDKPTDILSFPYYPHLVAGKRIKPASEEEKIVGDLIISAEYVVEEAKKYGIVDKII